MKVAWSICTPTTATGAVAFSKLPNITTRVAVITIGVPSAIKLQRTRSKSVVRRLCIDRQVVAAEPRKISPIRDHAEGSASSRSAIGLPPGPLELLASHRHSAREWARSISNQKRSKIMVESPEATLGLVRHVVSILQQMGRTDSALLRYIAYVVFLVFSLHVVPKSIRRAYGCTYNANFSRMNSNQCCSYRRADRLLRR